MDVIVQTSPDKERARSLLAMVGVRLAAIELMSKSDSAKFSSKIVEEWYEALFELATALLAADGYKTKSDIVGAHVETINFLRKNYPLNEDEITLLGELRVKRNGIKYHGKNIPPEFIQSRLLLLKKMLNSLKRLLAEKL